MEPIQGDFRATDLAPAAIEAVPSLPMPHVDRFHARTGGSRDPAKRDPYGSYEERASGFDAIRFESNLGDSGKRDALVSQCARSLGRCRASPGTTGS